METSRNYVRCFTHTLLQSIHLDFSFLFTSDEWYRKEPHLNKIVFFSGWDWESANVVTVDDIVEELLADGRQQKLLPDTRLENI